MAFTVDIDGNSGFCAGVVRAVNTAEDCLSRSGSLYSLGAIVHNEAELARLASKGMVTIDYEDLAETVDAGGKNLLIRAHGEPPQTYESAREKGFNIVDCTCPVVLRLQETIRKAWTDSDGKAQILIFGKPGHAEVLGLQGQIGGNAVVVEDMAALGAAIQSGLLRLDRPVEVFSQTTKSPAEYEQLCASLEAHMDPHLLTVHKTICSQVAARHARLAQFARNHDILVFVAGKASSNGRVLCDLCREHNIRTYHIDSVEDIRKEWFRPDDRVGVCGATSTPKWLLVDAAQKILQLEDNFILLQK